MNTPPLFWSRAGCWVPLASCAGGSYVDVSPGTGGRRSLNLASVPLAQQGPGKQACLPSQGAPHLALSRAASCQPCLLYRWVTFRTR